MVQKQNNEGKLRFLTDHLTQANTCMGFVEHCAAYTKEETIMEVDSDTEEPSLHDIVEKVFGQPDETENKESNEPGVTITVTPSKIVQLSTTPDFFPLTPTTAEALLTDHIPFQPRPPPMRPPPTLPPGLNLTQKLQQAAELRTTWQSAIKAQGDKTLNMNRLLTQAPEAFKAQGDDSTTVKNQINI